jgi:LacI family transcriptional regulator, galactose operon repressor
MMVTRPPRSTASRGHRGSRVTVLGMARATDQPISAGVTLVDVAQAAGVAVSTASRALANPDRVSRATRERVQDIARRLGYQHLRGGSQMLAMLVNDVTNPFHFGLIRGAEAQARAAGRTLVIAEAEENPDLEQLHATRLGPAVDGLILVASRLPDAELSAVTGARPCVLFNRELDGLSQVDTDVAESSRQIVDHLVALGHRRATYLGGPAAARSSLLRRTALTRAAADRNLELTSLGPFVPTLDQGAAAADEGLATGATALIAFNDLLAIGVLRRLGARGVRVPEDLSVIGHDDAFGADFCQPPLTTIAVPSERAGRLLVDLLLDAVAGQPPQRITLPTYLKVRESTGPAPAR